jgi:hypothetical protein
MRRITIASFIFKSEGLLRMIVKKPAEKVKLSSGFGEQSFIRSTAFGLIGTAAARSSRVVVKKEYQSAQIVSNCNTNSVRPNC